ncbi:unnamed protein product [Ixodes hexagonus]
MRSHARPHRLPYNHVAYGRLIFKAARTGDEAYVRDMLEGLGSTVTDYYLSSLYKGQLGSSTPLMAAARNGHCRLVSTLLTRYGARVDVEGSALFDDHYTVSGATALWHAVDGGHVDAAHSLLSRGADVNHRTQRRHGGWVEPEFMACDKTCLMLAAHRGHCAMVTCLLQHGADHRATSANDETCLHFAAKRGHHAVVRLLLAFDAEIVPNCYGETPLVQAAEWLHPEVVDLLSSRADASKLAKVEALELLGAAYVNNDAFDNPDRAFSCMASAMALRCSEPDPLPKRVLPAIPAYGAVPECATMSELAAIKDNPERLQIESLYIRERILGWNSPVTPRRMRFRAFALRTTGRYMSALQLWTRILEMKIRQTASLYDDLVEVTELLCQMLHYGVSVREESLSFILASCAREAELHSSKIGFVSNFDNHLHTCSYIVFIAARLFGDRLMNYSSAFTAIQRLVSLNQRTLAGQRTLLHLCLDEGTSIDGEFASKVIRFPCDLSAQLLIQAGHAVDCQDANLATPLHTICRTEKMEESAHVRTIRRCIGILADAGAHLDIVDSSQRTPENVAIEKLNLVALLTLKSLAKPCLKCIASRAVNRYGLTCGYAIPKTLRAFVKLHGI